MPGEVAQVVKTTDGCCDKYEVVCKPETCAIQPPTCPPPQVMKNSNPGACCPTFKCGKWLGVFQCHSLKDETQLNFNISQILVSRMPCTTNYYPLYLEPTNISICLFGPIEFKITKFYCTCTYTSVARSVILDISLIVRLGMCMQQVLDTNCCMYQLVRLVSKLMK